MSFEALLIAWAAGIIPAGLVAANLTAYRRTMDNRDVDIEDAALSMMVGFVWPLVAALSAGKRLFQVAIHPGQRLAWRALEKRRRERNLSPIVDELSKELEGR